MESGRVYTALYNRLKSPLLARMGSGCVKAVFRLPIRTRAAFGRRAVPIRGQAELARALEAVYPRPAVASSALPPLAPESGIDLSVLLPAYNCDQWVTDCVRSVLTQQTRFSFELIAVNDGSTDGTLAALQTVQDARFRVIDRPNGGASAARNAAIEAAGGRYLMFVDADDLLLPGAIEALLSQADASGADVVQGGWRYLDGSRPGQRYPDGSCSRDASLGFAGTPWAKLYRRTLFDRVRFPEGYRSFVDTIVKMLVFRLARSFASVSDEVYAWRQTAGGITSTAKRSPKALQTLWIVEEMLRQGRALGLPEDEYFEKILLAQLGGVMYRRLEGLDCRREAFEYACHMADQLPEIELSFGQRMTLLALRRHDEALWNAVCSRAYWIS